MPCTMRGQFKQALERYSAGRRILAVRRRILAVGVELRLFSSALASHRAGFAMPLNGQHARMQTMRTLLEIFSPDAIIETGTYLGDTTRFFSGNLIPVYSIEAKLSFHLLAKYRVGTYPDVTLIRGDSRRILDILARRQSFKRPIAYLDAHWDELPLQTEVTRILDAWEESVIVIDDFQVPEDPGYGFDTYRGVPLSLNLLHLPSSVVCAFPATLSYHETGARRGALYLGQGNQGARAIRQLAERGYLTVAKGSTAEHHQTNTEHAPDDG
jgi:hypothetical protein